MLQAKASRVVAATDGGDILSGNDSESTDSDGSTDSDSDWSTDRSYCMDLSTDLKELINSKNTI